jgi:hypothetical protein
MSSQTPPPLCALQYMSKPWCVHGAAMAVLSMPSDYGCCHVFTFNIYASFAARRYSIKQVCWPAVVSANYYWTMMMTTTMTSWYEIPPQVFFIARKKNGLQQLLGSAQCLLSMMLVVRQSSWVMYTFQTIILNDHLHDGICVVSYYSLIFVMLRIFNVLDICVCVCACDDEIRPDGDFCSVRMCCCLPLL